MAANHIKVQGLRELQADMRKLASKDLMNEVRAAHKKASDEVARASAAEAPEQSGKLAKSIKGRASNRAARVKAGTASRTPYAGPIHFGWSNRNIEPNEYLYRGIENALPKVQEEYEKEIQAIADKVGKRFMTKGF